ncbi:hypothetical protein CMV_015714 [Castanea mollissima]|uniref:Uncharacterized protein n=1 Tax=Castanea mollissima TaxID=60419 RepID=A0A8J4VSC6_9ROSI|nr:hypothetical protein CMV_015714 [Castanea mollissima]
MYSELCPKRFQSLFSKLIAGKLHCMGTNSLQEIWACDLDIHHCIQAQRIYLGSTLMELQESTKCVSSDISDGPIQRFVKIKFYENVESSGS